MKQARILFFIIGPVPTAEDVAKAGEIGAQVIFRNASAVGEYDKPEDCDGVEGAVPEAYKKFPSAAEGIAKKKREYAEAVKKAGEKLPPKRSQPQQPQQSLSTSVSTSEGGQSSLSTSVSSSVSTAASGKQAWGSQPKQ